MKTIMIYCSSHFKELAYNFASELIEKDKSIILFPSRFILDNPFHISAKQYQDYLDIDLAKLELVDYIYIITKYTFIDSSTYKLINRALVLNKKIIYKNF